jgi:cephalosporin hydroxylase
MAELYGTWEENFQQLLRWKAVVMEVSPDSVIEVDCHMDGEKRYFCRFFVHLGHVLRVLERDVDHISVWAPQY